MKLFDNLKSKYNVVARIVKKYTDGLRSNNLRYKAPTVGFAVITIWLALFADTCPNILRIISGCLSAGSIGALVVFRKKK